MNYNEEMYQVCNEWEVMPVHVELDFCYATQPHCYLKRTKDDR